MLSNRLPKLFESLYRTSAVRKIVDAGCATQAIKWDILTAVCVERQPVVTPALSEIQVKYKKYLEDLQFEKSFKSNHEMTHEQDVRNVEKAKNENALLVEEEAVRTITAQDFEDSCNKEFSEFTPSSIETEADKKNDIKSLERSLRSHLILLVEQNVGNKKLFLLPQGKHEEGETLRQTAERVFQDACGDSINVRFYGNAPCGFLKYKWKNDKKEQHGVKIFFYYAQHLSGNMNDSAEYKWATRNELQSTLKENYHSAVNQFLVDEINY